MEKKKKTVNEIKYHAGIYLIVNLHEILKCCILYPNSQINFLQ